MKTKTLQGPVAVLIWTCFSIWDPLGWSAALRTYVVDSYQQVAPKTVPAPDTPVVFAEIDEAALDRYGQWPWSRSDLAEILISLYENGAALVALDTLQSEPDRTSPAQLADRLATIPQALENDYGYLDWDEFFRDVLLQTPTVLATGADPDGETGVASPVAWAYVGDDPSTLLPNYPRLTPPLALFREAASGIGSISLLPDPDGLIRSIPTVTQIDGQLFLALSLESLRVAQQVSTAAIRADQSWGLEALKVGAYQIPVDRRGHLPLIYSAVDRVQRISLADIGSPASPIPQGAIVILGASALGLKDIHDSPAGLAQPGPLLHGAALVQILTETYLQIPLWGDLAMVLLALGGGLGLFWVARDRSSLSSSITGILAVALIIGGGWGSYLYADQLLAYSLPLGVWALCFATGITLRLAIEESGKREIRKAFGTYLAPALVNQIADDPSGLTLGGETRTLSVMFADLRGFTTLSEQYRDRPQALTQLVNQVMSPLSDAVLNTGGTIDKYLGDCVMAFWNAPVNEPRHADQSLESAHQIHIAVDDLNASLDDQQLRIAVGINTGQVVVGNFGSAQRFDYTCLGDPVNLCSRLEGLCRYYDVDVLVGESTVNALATPEIWSLLAIDRVAVKGKTEPVLVYWLQARMPNGDDRHLSALHAEMVTAYWDMQWTQAQAALDKLATTEGYPERLIEIYRDRINGYQANPPSDDWDGVFRATSKQGD